MISKIGLYIFLGTLGLFAVTSCVHDDDFKVPGDVENIEEPDLDGDTVSISAVINNLTSYDDADQYTFEDTDHYMVGYVVSSDEGGNFYQELILQDKPENPSAGIQLLIESDPLFTKYNPGRKLYIKLEGFTVALSKGVYALGVPDGEFIQEAPRVFEKKIVRSAEIDSLVPKVVDIDAFSDEVENMLIKINDVQFTNEDAIENELSYAGEASDDFDGLRRLESCHSDITTQLSTSTFSDFKDLPLPKKSGSITAVLSRTFDDDAYVVKINDPSAIRFNQERCDPLVLDCGLSDSEGSQILFSDDFEGQSTGEPVSGNGWTNYVESGSVKWSAFYDTQNDPSMSVAAKVDVSSADEASNVAWLITPKLNLSARDRVSFSFETSNSYANGSTLKIFFSKDWDGQESHIASADWAEITAAQVVENDVGFQTVVSSGIVDLSCVEEDGYIAFKYVGSSDTDYDGVYELNNVKVTAP